MSQLFIRVAAAAFLAGVHLAGNAQDLAQVASPDAVSAAQPIATCCQQLKTLARLPLPLERTELKLDEKSPAHNFGQGAQAFLLLELPAYTKTYAVTISNVPQARSSFSRSELTQLAMRIETLDADFLPVRVYPHTGMKKRGNGYDKTVFINPSNQNERYLLVYGALNAEPETLTLSRTDVVFVGTGFFIGGIDNALTVRAASSGLLVVEAKGLQAGKP
ncbi:hypothetical protein [Polaromonas sp.]|uniref:hypothetical protein n=1 Tax=Polaromonas sp. TaxID=1869339 RepID=UPI00326723E8